MTKISEPKVGIGEAQQVEREGREPHPLESVLEGFEVPFETLENGQRLYTLEQIKKGPSKNSKLGDQFSRIRIKFGPPYTRTGPYAASPQVKFKKGNLTKDDGPDFLRREDNFYLRTNNKDGDGYRYPLNNMYITAKTISPNESGLHIEVTDDVSRHTIRIDEDEDEDGKLCLEFIPYTEQPEE